MSLRKESQDHNYYVLESDMSHVKPRILTKGSSLIIFESKKMRSKHPPSLHDQGIDMTFMMRLVFVPGSKFVSDIKDKSHRRRRKDISLDKK